MTKPCCPTPRTFRVWALLLSGALFVSPFGADAAWAQHRGSYWGGYNRYTPGQIDLQLSNVWAHAPPPAPDVGTLLGVHDYYAYFERSRHEFGSNWQPAEPVLEPGRKVTTANANPWTPKGPYLGGPPEPQFGAFIFFSRVAPDLSRYADQLAETIVEQFQYRPDFDQTYSVVERMRQQCRSILDRSCNPEQREAVRQGLPQLDDDLHLVIERVGMWLGDTPLPAKTIARMRHEIGQFGGALRYLMIDAGVLHHEPLAPRTSADGRAVVAGPAFGAYAEVPKVASDVVQLADRLCVTIRDEFGGRWNYSYGQSAANEVLVQAAQVRELAATSTGREAVALRLAELDASMHRAHAQFDVWIDEPRGATVQGVARLKRDLELLGNAVHFLMIDVGVEHADGLHLDDRKVQ